MVALASAPDKLVTTYLEMTRPSQLRDTYQPRADVRIERMTNVDTDFYRYLYRSVGEKWRWRDRLVMPKSELRDILASENTYVYVMYVSGAPAGYVELSRQGSKTEIAYFGLREAYHGRGLGKQLLAFGIQKAWDLGTNRVWVHTCNLDGPHALQNYKKRGFQVYMEHTEEMPDLYQ